MWAFLNKRLEIGRPVLDIQVRCAPADRQIYTATTVDQATAVQLPAIRHIQHSNSDQPRLVDDCFHSGSQALIISYWWSHLHAHTYRQ